MPQCSPFFPPVFACASRQRKTLRKTLRSIRIRMSTKEGRGKNPFGRLAPGKKLFTPSDPARGKRGIGTRRVLPREIIYTEEVKPVPSALRKTAYLEHALARVQRWLRDGICILFGKTFRVTSSFSFPLFTIGKKEHARFPPIASLRSKKGHRKFYFRKF